MKPPLTVIIPCKDERRNIRPCIESIRPIADEILVADSGSTDGTLDIVREMGGCRIIEREYIHSGDFKNWAIPQATHPWVFIIDSDERVTPDLADEINGLLTEGPLYDGYWVYRLNYFLGHPVRLSGWRSGKCLRLFRRDRGRYVGDTDHAEVQLSTGRAGKLRHRLLHYTYWTYDHYFNKLQRYTKWQAQVWYKQGRRPSYPRMLINAWLRFLRAYIVQGGFLDGWIGLHVSMTTGFYSFLKQARLWELHHALPQPDPEAERAEADAAAAPAKEAA